MFASLEKLTNDQGGGRFNAGVVLVSREAGLFESDENRGGARQKSPVFPLATGNLHRTIKIHRCSTTAAVPRKEATSSWKKLNCRSEQRLPILAFNLTIQVPHSTILRYLE